MKLKLIVAAVLAALMTACSGNVAQVVSKTEHVTQAKRAMPTEKAMHCVEWVGGICVFWAPDPPSGMFDCTSDPTVYPGEFLMFTGTNHTGFCIGFNSSNSFPSLGDMNNIVRSVKNRRGHAEKLYANQNYGGSNLTVADNTDPTDVNWLGAESVAPAW